MLLGLPDLARTSDAPVSDLVLLLSTNTAPLPKHRSVFTFKRSLWASWVSVCIPSAQTRKEHGGGGVILACFVARAAQRRSVVVELQDFAGSLIVSVVQFRCGVLFNGTAVRGEAEATFFLFWKVLVGFAD